MYNTWGVHIVKMVRINDFLQKIARKTLILADTILDHLTLERASTQNFKDYDLFHGCSEKFGT